MASAPLDPHIESQPNNDAENVAQPPQDSPGIPGGTAGTGGENKVQDSDFER
jgi:hypothetical protein